MTPSLFSEDLFGTIDREPPSVRGSETSIAAAKAIESRAGTDRRRVLEFIASRGALGATDEEMQLALAMQGNTQRPRRRELDQAAHIVKSGQKRKTLAGNPAVVWIAAKGKA